MKIKTVLPSSMEGLFFKLVRFHNAMVFGAFVIAFVLEVVLMQLNFNFLEPRYHLSTIYWWFNPALMGVMLVVIFALLPIILMIDRRLSTAWGFVCPHCGAPLYRAGSTFENNDKLVQYTGLCPKCHQSVLPSS